MVENEEGRTRIFTYGEHEFTATATDPYGFWTVTTGQGSTPKEFQQSFTGLSDVDRAIKNYLSRKELEANKLTREEMRQIKTFPAEALSQETKKKAPKIKD